MNHVKRRSSNQEKLTTEETSSFLLDTRRSESKFTSFKWKDMQIKKCFRFLRLTWPLIFLIGEIVLPYFSVRNCHWPEITRDENGKKKADARPPYRLAILADPQLTDFYSYGMAPGSWVLKLTEFYSGTFVKFYIHTIP